MFEMNSIGFNPSYACNLKCKFCAVRSPYLRNTKTHTVEEMMEMADRMFKIVDLAHHVSISGGEPLIYKDLPIFIDQLMKYKDQFEKIDIITNGTIVPSEELISVIRRERERERERDVGSL